MSAAPVTVIGLGPMGQAMSRTLLRAGHQVTVWNRTPSRADDLVAAGARLAASPAEAVAASELIILSLTDYQAMWDVLADVGASLTGRTLTNLSSDTPDKTREAANWASSHGASFVTGGVMVPAPMVGTDLAYIYYSGDQRGFEAHRNTLAHLGDPRFLGDDPGLAQLMYQANLDVFLTTLAGCAHAIALAGSAGIAAEMFLPGVMQLIAAIPDMIAPGGTVALGARIDAGEHPGTGSNNIMMGATADHILATTESADIDTALPKVVQTLYRRAIDDGHGTDGWTRTIDAIRARKAST
ncbi:NAD(P)-dependent oxidoreductase [Nocardia sp. alder85J]|uniref:NAD(P)-dependent oxidoreductase n=1 Tax=Nocardia sp. alder85J TaxID=2862949 RepID=UPI001CD280BE|nr:NAD(P)-binding domain-containing protein [Nocardia sp. alder85J]MCX4091787.1 NAD(P)-binding domain-containing protein [Nocardia sp. alder85J]